MIGLKTAFLEALYLKAKYAFNYCITNEKDELKDEIDFPLAETIAIEEAISFQFSKLETNKFVVEVKMHLKSPDGRLIGSYYYYEDEAGIPCDDFLIFD